MGNPYQIAKSSHICGKLYKAISPRLTSGYTNKHFVNFVPILTNVAIAKLVSVCLVVNFVKSLFMRFTKILLTTKCTKVFTKCTKNK